LKNNKISKILTQSRSLLINVLHHFSYRKLGIKRLCEFQKQLISANREKITFNLLRFSA